MQPIRCRIPINDTHTVKRVFVYFRENDRIGAPPASTLDTRGFGVSSAPLFKTNSAVRAQNSNIIFIIIHFGAIFGADQ